MATPTHFHSIDKAIPAAGWNSIRNRVAQIAEALEDNGVLTVNLPPYSKDATNDYMTYLLGTDAAFTVHRKWPKSWPASASIKSSADCPPVWDLFQRAALLVASHYARTHSVDFKIVTEGSFEGWCLAAKVAAWATEDPIYESDTYLPSLVSSGYLAPAKEADGYAEWAVAEVDAPIFAIATTKIAPAERAPCTTIPVSMKWFF
jgi:hypothetical protein